MIAIEVVLNMAEYDAAMTQYLRTRYMRIWSRSSFLAHDNLLREEVEVAENLSAAYSAEECDKIYTAWKESFPPGTHVNQTPEYIYSQHYQQFTTTKQ